MADDVYNYTYTDAYKGDGFKGLGDFFAGLAQAYHEIDRTTDFTESHLTPAQKAQVQQWIDAGLARFTSDEFKKSIAWDDADQAMDEIFARYQEDDLPQIYSPMCRAGLYNNTTIQLLANEAYARTVRKAAELRIDTGIRYAEVETGRSQPVNQAVSSALQDNTARHETFNEEYKPLLGDFLTDAAIILALMSLLDLFSKRTYFADTK